MSADADEGGTVEVSTGAASGAAFATSLGVGAATGDSGRGDTAPRNTGVGDTALGDTALGDSVRSDGTPATVVGASVLLWTDSASMRSAAGRVRRYPAAYTVSTAAELRATRLFALFWLEPRPFSAVMDRRL
jgi:hypothetical protein